MGSERRDGGGRDLVGGFVVALGALLFGAVVVIGRTDAVRGLPVAPLLAVRFGVAAVVLVVILAATRQPVAPPRGEWPVLVALGAVGYAVESGLFFLALERGTAATVTLLFYTYPVWVAVLSAVLGMGVPGLLVGGSLVAAVAGSALVVGSSGGLDITAAGIAFALASSVTISLFLIALQRWVRRTPPLVSSLWVAASASVALTAATLVGRLRFPTEAREWLAVGGMGVLTAGAFMLLFLGVRRVGAVRSSVIASLEPVMAAVLAWIVLGEALRAGVIGGGALILAGAVAASLARARPEPEAGPHYQSRPDWPRASRSWNTVRATGPEGGAAMDADRLKVVPLFESLSDAERRQVAQWTDEVEVQPGYHLVDQGAFAHEFFVILEGTAEVTKDGERITELGPGDFFGEIALLGMERRTASVVASSPMRLAVMFGRDFRQMEHSMPEVHGRIEGAMRARLQD